MTAQGRPPFVPPPIYSEENLAGLARVMERIARQKAAGVYVQHEPNARETYNSDTGRWEYAPICAGGIQRDLDHQADLRAREAAIYARVNGKRRSYAATGTIRCEDCRGDGLINADAGIAGTTRFCDCPTCHGTGYRK